VPTTFAAQNPTRVYDVLVYAQGPGYDHVLLVRAADAKGVVRELDASGLLARAFRHEVDHLNRTLFVDRLRGLKRELTWKKIEKRKAKGIW